jgi:DNA recombination protein Rad52
MTLTKEQIELLNQPIDLKNVAERESGWGDKVPYVESWKAIDAANRIFGFDGWNSETLEVNLVSEDIKCVSYIAKVRITVGNVIKEGYGSGHGRKGGIGDKHESAIKEAESDAQKRALRQFGYQFGLSLYDVKKAWKTADSSNKKLKKEESKPPVSQKSTTFVLAKQAIEKCRELKKLDSYTDTFNDRLNEGKLTKEEYSKLTDLLEAKYVNLTEAINS